MKTILINGVHYNPRQVVSCDIQALTVLLRFVDGQKFRIKMDSIVEANSFRNDLINSW